jgi:predicted amidohydrolase
MLSSLAAYRNRISEWVERSLAYRPDLIVFPEYTAAFLALVPHRRALEGAASVAQGLERVRAADPLVRDLRELFLLNSGWVERAMESVFGDLAGRYGVTILAGSYFAWAEAENGAGLTNRAVVFGADGRRVYQQDKVYLTPFEEELLGLSPGKLSAAAPFRVAGARVGLTICRDSFFSAWEEQLRGSDLWVDIKANGTAYTEEERRRFERALPARIRSGGVPYGLTVCLTGAYLDLLWEGASALVQRQSPPRACAPQIVTLLAALSPREKELLLCSVPIEAPGR